MLKYVNSDIVCQEIPGHVTLAINISNCPCRCPGCHSTYLSQDIGTELTPSTLSDLISRRGDGATCVSFMGGDADPRAVSDLAAHVRRAHPHLATAWYSGRTILSPLIDRRNFAFIKVGPYIEHLGPLNSRTTNQRLYRVMPGGELEDITSCFWRR